MFHYTKNRLLLRLKCPLCDAGLPIKKFQINLYDENNKPVSLLLSEKGFKNLKDQIDVKLANNE